MQFLLFSLGNDRYGLDTRCVARVLPQLELKEIPQAPPWVAGLMNYRGQPVPVVDLTMLARGVPSRVSYDTRIILVDYRGIPDIGHPLGLLVEQASDIRHFATESFMPSGIDASGAPYLGKVAASGGEMVQLVDVDNLLPPEVQIMLFPAET
jgi:chemotaxis-related protein WspB